MTRAYRKLLWLLRLALTALTWLELSQNAIAQPSHPTEIAVPTGKVITPTAARGAFFTDLNPGNPDVPQMLAGQAASVAVSPDGRLLAVLTSGYNVYFGVQGHTAPDASTEYVFLFDLSGPVPKQTQAIRLPHAFQGLVWAPSSDRLFASGGRDDTVIELVRLGSEFSTGRTFPLGHKGCVGRDKPSRSTLWGTWSYPCGPETAGLAINRDGTRLLVANLQNDSVSLIDLTKGQVVAEQDLRPGLLDPTLHGSRGGSFPRSVTWTSPDRAYVASERDREIIALGIHHDTIHVLRRIPVHGQPVALLANRAGSRLYVALDTTSQIAILDTADDKLLESVDVTAPQTAYVNSSMLGGANTNALVLTPDERMLLASNGGENAVAVVQLGDRARDAARDGKGLPSGSDQDDDDIKPANSHSAVIGLVPTGWYPTGIATSKDGTTWYAVNAKSPTGPNTGGCEDNSSTTDPCGPDHPADHGLGAGHGWGRLIVENEFIEQLEHAGFLSFPAPTPLELARLTRQVAHNNRFDQPEKSAADERLFSFLRDHIKHVVYVIKENRTYDQILGDLEIGDGDPHLAIFPEAISPNHHRLAREFVTFDNFLVSGEGSWTGWDWSFAAQTTDLEERGEPLVMPGADLKAEDGLKIGSSWVNRGINVGYATSEERRAIDPTSPADPDILPGASNVFAPDGPGGEEGRGFIWDAALRQGLTVRGWGIFTESSLQPVRDPYGEKVVVSWASTPSLVSRTDPYYHGINFGIVPDFWRIHEWQREFAEFSAAGHAPSLMMLALPNDHLGRFDRAIDGVNTPETQIADNDYALGLLVESVAKSPFAENTLIIAVEDDSCDGPDHVDAHRSIVLFAGPYVRQHALVSSRYTTVNLVRTIEEILGIGPIGLNDALAVPMSEAFDPSLRAWSYKANVPDVLRSTELPLPPADHTSNAKPKKYAQYWIKAMAHQDFSGLDRVDPATFNRALWRGLKGETPYPVARTHKNLRANRPSMLDKTKHPDRPPSASGPELKNPDPKSRASVARSPSELPSD